MTNQEPAPFTVVDRRVASQGDAEVAGDTSSENHPGILPEQPEASEASPTDVETSETAPQGTNTSADGQDETALPNAALHLSMAAMHLKTKDLVNALIPVFDAHAWQNMGLIANPMTGEANKDLPAAQLAIDAVQFLLGKAENSLSDTERRDLQRRLNDLRMNYLAKLREG